MPVCDLAVASRHAQLLGDRYESPTRVKSIRGYLSPIRVKGKTGHVSPTHAEGKSDYLSPTRVKRKLGYLSPTRASILKSAVKASSKNRRRRQRKTSPRVRRAAQRAAQRKHGLSSSPPTLPRLQPPRLIASEQVGYIRNLSHVCTFAHLHFPSRSRRRHSGWISRLRSCYFKLDTRKIDTQCSSALKAPRSPPPAPPRLSRPVGRATFVTAQNSSRTRFCPNAATVAPTASTGTRNLTTLTQSHAASPPSHKDNAQSLL